MKKCGMLAAGACLAAALLSGCGQTVPEDITGSALAVEKSGSVTAYLVGEFDKPYYDLTELTTMAREEAREFCGGLREDAVTVESVEEARDGSGRIVLAYRFDGAESYERFSGDQFFYGTVGEAVQKGLIGDPALQDAKTGEPMLPGALEKQMGKHMIITDAAMTVYCPGSVAYLSAGAALAEDGGVDVSQASGTVYILLKR